MQTYQKYHSDVIIAANLNILPAPLREQIPKSTLHNFSKADLSNLIGANYFSNMDFIKQFAQDKKAIELYKALLRIKRTLLLTKDMLKINRDVCREKIVRVIERVKDTLGIEKACRYLNITRTTLKTWKQSLKFKCTDSPQKKVQTHLAQPADN